MIKEGPTQLWPFSFICKESLNHEIWNYVHNVVDSSDKLSLTNHLIRDLESDRSCFLYHTRSTGLTFTKLSNSLEHFLVNLLFICVWKMAFVLFTITLCCNLLWWRQYGLLHYQMHSSNFLNGHESLNISSLECAEALTDQVFFIENFDLFRSIGKKHAKKEMDKHLHEANFSITKDSGLLGSSNQSLTTSATPQVFATKHLPPALDVEPDSSIIKPTSYTTNQLPGATASHHQQYETNFDEDLPPVSTEETRKNVRPVLKENDVDSILKSHQRTQITPKAIPQPFVQDKLKTFPSSSVNKSHRSLPRKACVVYLKEQYHLDHNLLSQPTATKYLVKVRSEISPGRYMAKLELHCSRYVIMSL